MTDDEGARLVGTGTFKVDRARALEKIRAYRSGSLGAVFLFIRAAAASGAKEFTVEEAEDSLTLRWDGAPLGASFFEDPYRELIGESSESDPASRWTALALLHAFGPDVEVVTVESGPEGARRLLAAAELGEERQKPGMGSGGTVVRVWAPRCDRLWCHPFSAEARERGFGVVWSRLRLEFPYARLAARKAAEGGESGLAVEWEAGAVRCRLAVPERVEAAPSVAVYAGGVLAGFLDRVPGLPSARGWLDDPALPLDASHVSYVDGERLAELSRGLAAGSGGLVEAVRRVLADGLPGTVALLREDGWHLRLWRRRLHGPTVEGELESLFQYQRDSVKAATARRVVDLAQAMLWLRRLTVAAPNGSSFALDDAPVAFGPGLEVMTLASLRAAARQGLTYARDVGTTAPAPAVWEDGAVREFWEMLKAP